MLMQSSQPEPMQLSSMTMAFGHSLREGAAHRRRRSLRIASGGQTTPQAPQSMQRSGSIMWSWLRSPVMASVGQRLVQAVQPIHVSMMEYGKTGSSPGFASFSLSRAAGEVSD